MIKSKSSASPIVNLSSFVIHLVNGAQFLNATEVEILYATVMISPLTKIQESM